jgi:hypothetical protein
MPIRSFANGLGLGAGISIGKEVTKNLMGNRGQNQQGQAGVECANCRTMNQAGMKFCGSCGAEIIIAVPSIGTGIACACGVINEEGRKFCSECGGKLEAKAPATGPVCACGVANEEGRKFCRDCGAKLEAVATEIAEAPEAAVAAEAAEAPEAAVAAEVAAAPEAAVAAEAAEAPKAPVCACGTEIGEGQKFCRECGKPVG